MSKVIQFEPIHIENLAKEFKILGKQVKGLKSLMENCRETKRQLSIYIDSHKIDEEYRLSLETNILALDLLIEEGNKRRSLLSRRVKQVGRRLYKLGYWNITRDSQLRLEETK